MSAQYRTDGQAPRRPLRLAVLVSHPIQYFAPQFRALAALEGVELTVHYRTRVGLKPAFDPGFRRIVQWDIPLLDGYRACFLSGKTDPSGFQPRIFEALGPGRFDALLVHGYDNPTHLVAIALARLWGCRVLLRGDTRCQSGHRLAAPWRGWVKRLLFRWIDGFLAIGSLNRDYYLALGADPARVFFAPFGVDNSAFALDTTARGQHRARIRTELGLGATDPVAIFVAKLTAQKRPSDLLEAAAQAAAALPNLSLLIVGSGDLESALIAQAQGLSLTRARFLGFRNQSELPALLAAADFFVLPAQAEAWGLAVNEAMAAGLPVILSDQVGAAADLVRERGTGIVYPCGNVAALSQALVALGESATLRETMGARAGRLIQSWGPAATATAILAAARAAVGWPGPPPWRLESRSEVAAGGSPTTGERRPERPRILIAVRSYLPGYRSGGPVRSLANLQERLGADFEFLVLAYDRDIQDTAPYPSIVANDWSPVGRTQVLYLTPGLGALSRLARAIRTTRHDLLYINSLFDPVFAGWPLLLRLLGRSGGAPVLVAPRGELSLGALTLRRWKKLPYLRAAQAIGLYRSVIWHASSADEAGDIFRVFGPRSGQILTALNLPEASGGATAATVAERKRAGALQVVFLSRIAPKKNLLFALEVLAQARVPLDLAIYGPLDDAAYWRRCQARIERLPPQVRARYAGPVPHREVVPTLARYDLFFLPTLGENYGHVILEAMTAGTPVLIADTTPWRGLTDQGLGWDLSLGETAPWVACIQEAAGRDAADYAAWRGRVRAFARAKVADPGPLEATRRLLYRAAGRQAEADHG